MLLNALLVWVLCVDCRKSVIYSYGVADCEVEHYAFLAADGVHPRVLQELRYETAELVLIKLLKMVSNLSAKSAFGRGVEVGKYNPSLFKSVRVLLCQFDMSYSKEWDWYV